MPFVCGKLAVVLYRLYPMNCYTEIERGTMIVQWSRMQSTTGLRSRKVSNENHTEHNPYTMDCFIPTHANLYCAMVRYSHIPDDAIR